MSPRKRKPNDLQGGPRKPRKMAKKKGGSVTYILEQGTLGQLHASKARMKRYLRYHWDHYSSLAVQRNEIQDQLTQTLNEACSSDFEFKEWQRAVKYKYSLHPLSTVGSIRDIGGRFNVGDINPNVPKFPALYITRDKNTALQETLGQVPVEDAELTPQELALSNSQSESLISVSGKLDRVFDLTTWRTLRGFTNLIKGFKIPGHVTRQAKSLGEEPWEIVRTPSKLRQSLLEKNWRNLPRLVDVPSNSQVFGHLVYLAKIEGILFPSKFTGEKCLAIFPRNFEKTTSYIQIDGELPHENTPKRIDGNNWRQSELMFSELD